MMDIWTYLPPLITGLIMTLKIFSLTVLWSLPLGVIVALGRNHKNPLLQGLVSLYIWIMRGTPLLLQLVFIFFGLPAVGIVLDRFMAAGIAFVLNYTAYFAEIFRSGFNSIDAGQREAAKVLGLSPLQTLYRIILPQVVKKVLPPVANEVITLFKDTALVYVVGLGELLRAGKIMANRDATLMPLVLVGVIYLGITYLLTKGFEKMEAHYGYYQ